LNRIKHTYILEDPYDDPPQLPDFIPEGSPEGKPKDEVRVDCRSRTVFHRLYVMIFSVMRALTVRTENDSN
jgi:hypothetical protein